MIEWAGLAPWSGSLGTLLVIGAYIPQIVHLVRERCSSRVSIAADTVWCAASLILLTYTVSLRDPVFVAPQLYQAGATGLIALLTWHCNPALCERHRAPGQAPGVQVDAST